ncbi:MAG: hypothetical protein JNL67_12980 [Planctomycetaceae bacterium]|nr:hypothetical protein [Planctomycetaceae bacterium]
MSDSLTIYRLLKKDPRYPIEAYQFVREGLTYATEVLALGQKSANDLQKTLTQQEALEQSSSDFQKEIDLIAGITASERADETESSFDLAELDDPQDSSETPTAEIEGRHLTGQELCEALRQYALQQYGYMAFSVLSQWGISATRDFGSIVYNLIEIGLMRKSAEDRQEHFNDVYDFHEVFIENFQF